MEVCYLFDGDEENKALILHVKRTFKSHLFDLTI